MRPKSDLLLFAVVGGVVLWALFGSDSGGPARLPRFEKIGPPEAAVEENLHIRIGDPATSSGTAFALTTDGMWVTARHVSDGCDRIGLAIGDGRMLPAEERFVSASSDLALLRTGEGRDGPAFDVDGDRQIGETAYMIGFPHGRPGEVAARFLGSARLTGRGRYRIDDNVSVWARTGRDWGASLSGMSGGPVLDADGQVIGALIAQNKRRGRLYSASSHALAALFADAGIGPNTRGRTPLSARSYRKEAKRLRKRRSVVKLTCIVS